MNKDVLKAMGFSEEVARVEWGMCPFCSKKIDADSFRDELSVKEFKISGLCQECQDLMFGGGD